MRGRAWSMGFALLASPLVISACHQEHHDEPAASTTPAADPDLVSRDTNRKLGPGDLRVVSTDSSIEVAVVDKSVITGLGPRALAEVSKSTDTGAVKGSGFAASLEKMVKSSVQSALSHELVFPIASISDVKTDKGSLEFYDNSGKRMVVFGNDKGGSVSSSGRFTDGDANAFIAAFRARKAAVR